VFDETVVLNFTANSATLTVPSNERHDGTAGTGVRVVVSVNDKYLDLNCPATQVLIVEWLEWDHNNKKLSNANGHASVLVRDGKAHLLNCIVHDLNDTSYSATAIHLSPGSPGDEGQILSCIIYDVLAQAGSANIGANGIRSVNLASTPSRNIQNNTIHNVQTYGGTDDANGIFNQADNSGLNLQNNIVTDTSSFGGVGADYVGTFTLATADHNLSSDATASGTGSLTSKTSANQFVSTVGGSEDLHLKAGADAIDAGTDLGTTPSGVEIDIDGRDRDAEGDAWDMGADELVVIGGPFPHHIRRAQSLSGGLIGIGGL